MAVKNVPAPKVPDSVVVEVSAIRSELVPYAKPRMVVEAPPSFKTFPFRVMEVVVTSVEVDVLTVGTVEGITGFDGSDGSPVPRALDAVTVKVYETPFVNPVTVIGEALLELAMLSGLEVTV